MKYCNAVFIIIIIVIIIIIIIIIIRSKGFYTALKKR